MRCDAPVDGSAVARPRNDPGAQRAQRATAQRAKKMQTAFAYAPANAPVVPRRAARASTSMSGVVPALAAKVAQIQAACPGAHVISAIRHTRIRGTRRLSLHATGEAVDMRGNASCVYAQLRDWPGGYSTDYGRVKHIHISLAANGREAGLRFVHGGGKSHRHRRFANR